MPPIFPMAQWIRLLPSLEALWLMPRIKASTCRLPTFSLSPSGNQSLNIGGSKQIAVTTNSDGAVSASSSAPGVARRCG